MAEERINAETEVTTTELACVLGVSGRRIRQLAEDGTLEKTSRGKFNLCAAVRGYFRKDPAEDEDTAKFTKIKLQSETAIKVSMAKIAKLEADELEGKMHRSEDVEAVTADLIYAMRGALIALPGRLAVDVANASGAAEAAKIIRAEIHRAMESIANYQYDPKRYEELVRERMRWGGERAETDDDE